MFLSSLALTQHSRGRESRVFTWLRQQVELVNTVLVCQASLLTQLVAVAPELVAVLMKLQSVALESNTSGMLAVHPQSLSQLVLVHRGGVVMGQVGLVRAVSEWQSFLTPVLRELCVSIEETLQNLQLALHFCG